MARGDYTRSGQLRSRRLTVELALNRIAFSAFDDLGNPAGGGDAATLEAIFPDATQRARALAALVAIEDYFLARAGAER